MPEQFPPSRAYDLPGLDACSLPLGSLCQKHNPLPRPNAFGALVQELRDILGSSSGIDSSDVEVKDLKDAMSKYRSDEAEWKEFAFADESRHYTRNFVDHGNGKANLLVLVWNPGKGSLIHDHAGAHCIMKVCMYVDRQVLYKLLNHLGVEGQLARDAL